MPAGVRLELDGDATAVGVHYTTATGDSGVRGDGGGRTFEAWTRDGLLDTVHAVVGPGTVELQLGARPGPVTVHLPEVMRPRIDGLRPVGGELVPGPAKPRWVAYGDSILEGWVASAPAQLVGTGGPRLDLDLVNLGYAGAARGEIASAEAVAGLDASIVTLSYGTNCWSMIPHSERDAGCRLRRLPHDRATRPPDDTVDRGLADPPARRRDHAQPARRDPRFPPGNHGGSRRGADRRRPGPRPGARRAAGRRRGGSPTGSTPTTTATACSPTPSAPRSRAALGSERTTTPAAAGDLGGRERSGGSRRRAASLASACTATLTGVAIPWSRPRSTISPLIPSTSMVPVPRARLCHAEPAVRGRPGTGRMVMAPSQRRERSSSVGSEIPAAVVARERFLPDRRRRGWRVSRRTPRRRRPRGRTARAARCSGW